jgi:1-deoxy-D-xylulose-5-phosphate reductoisomerase
MVVLGSTGSIGSATLHLAEKFGIEVEGVVAGENWRKLGEQIRKFNPRLVAVKSEEVASRLPPFDGKVEVGEEGILKVLEESKSQLVINGLVGESGLKPTLKALELGKKVGLANKESLVIAGWLIEPYIKRGQIVPIDSEHFALMRLLEQKSGKVAKLVITASGGAVREVPLHQFPNLTPQQVLKHPNWQMGKKITIDSATMVNKLFELIEARWLFGIGAVEGVIEQNSLVHGLVIFESGEITAHLSSPDMLLPIAYALLGELPPHLLPPLDPITLPPLQFSPIGEERYPVWRLKNLLLEKPHLGAVLNTLNDQLVPLFLKGKIPFPAIAHFLIEGVEKFIKIPPPTSLPQLFHLKGEVLNWFKRELKGRWNF